MKKYVLILALLLSGCVCDMTAAINGQTRDTTMNGSCDADFDFGNIIKVENNNGHKH